MSQQRTNAAKLSDAELAALDFIIRDLEEKGVDLKDPNALAMATPVVREVVREVVRQAVAALARTAVKGAKDPNFKVSDDLKKAFSSLAVDATLDELIAVRRLALQNQ